MQKVASATDAQPSQAIGRAPAFSPAQIGEWIGIAALVGVCLFLLFTKNASFFNFWTDRDMVRSANLLNEFQYMAAELSYGAASRVPGGALHYLWWIPTAFSSDPNWSYKFCILLCMLACIPFYQAMRNSFGASAAIVSTAVLLASPVTFSTMMRLWNPSFQVPFLILAFAFMIRHLAAKEAWAFKWMIASLVVSMQMHVSTWLLMIAWLPVYLILRPKIGRKEAVLALVISLLLMLPYIIGEMMNGWDNIRTMMASQGKGAVRRFEPSKGFLFNFDNSRDIWAWFGMTFGMTDNLPQPPLQTAFSWLHNLGHVIGALFLIFATAHWLGWGKPIGRLLGADFGGGAARVALASFAPLFLAFAYLSYSPQMELVVYGNSRYIMFAVTGLAVLAGLGAGAVMSMARSSKPAQFVAAGIVAVATAVPLASLAESMLGLARGSSEPGRQFMGAFNLVKEDRKWSLEDTVARLSILRHHEDGDKWRFESIFGIGYELYRYKLNQPFSRGGECAAFLTSGTDVYGAKGMSSEALARSFQQPGIDVRILSQRSVGKDRLVIYERPGKPCFTTITNRYVFSPEENAMFKRYGDSKRGHLIPQGKSEPSTETTKAGEKAYIGNLGQGIYVMVKLHAAAPETGKVHVELHSNQLRGDTYNGGFLELGMINAPRLTFTSPGRDPITLTLDNGLVGGKGTFTPMQTVFDLPAGTYSVKLDAEVYPPVPLGTWPVDFSKKTPVSVPLDQAFVAR
jgi:Dolichyl-phosphate-mannose-protein mannosyltransferase